MTTYLCTYDLNHEIRRPPIVEEIKRTGFWAMLSESSYAIDTTESAEQVFQRFQKHLDGNDYFLVIPLRGPYSGQNDTKVISWLNQHLRL